MKRHWKSICVLITLPLALLARFLASARPDLTETLFSRGVYPPVAALASAAMSVFPFSVVEILVVIFILFLIYWVFKRKFRAIALCVCLILAIFLGGWSLNYFRLPLEETLALSMRAEGPEALVALCESLADDANARHSEPPPDILARVPDALDVAAESWPIPKGMFAKPKAALSSPLLSRFLITGIASPFTGEALVNGGIPAVSLPYVACHEAAHVRGFAREEDANLVAYLACEASGEPFFRYSGAVEALVYAMGALKDTNPAAHEAIEARLSAPVRADLAERAAYWAAYRGNKAAEVGARVNDAYLETMGGGDQSARSYGRVVDLLLALKAQADEKLR